MLADHAARILAGGTGFGPKAGREGREAQRQVLLVQHHVVHQVGERHFGGRDQPVAVLGVEHVLGELRQLADAVDGRVLHQKRRVDLGVAVHLGMQVQHELCNCPFEPGQPILQEDEA